MFQGLNKKSVSGKYSGARAADLSGVDGNWKATDIAGK
jgi:hypothetical protein